jgi:hypothetical protein
MLRVSLPWYNTVHWNMMRCTRSNVREVIQLSCVMMHSVKVLRVFQERFSPSLLHFKRHSSSAWGSWPRNTVPPNITLLQDAPLGSDAVSTPRVEGQHLNRPQRVRVLGSQYPLPSRKHLKEHFLGCGVLAQWECVRQVTGRRQRIWAFWSQNALLNCTHIAVHLLGLCILAPVT